MRCVMKRACPGNMGKQLIHAFGGATQGGYFDGAKVS